MSKIEQIIAELEEYIDKCKYQPLSNSKIIVNRDELDEIIEELKMSIPDEIKKYQRIIANRDAILRDAQDKSDIMIKKANQMTSNLVSEHEIMQQAYKEASRVIEEATSQAGRILDKATAEANEVKRAAMQYTDRSLSDIQDILSNAIENLTVKNDAIIRSLESSLDITTQNRKELHAMPIPESTYAVRKEAEEAERSYSLYDSLDDEDYIDDLYDYPDKYEASYQDDSYEGYEEEEPIYGQHNPNWVDVDSEFASGSDIEEITNFKLDIGDFK